MAAVAVVVGEGLRLADVLETRIDEDRDVLRADIDQAERRLADARADGVLPRDAFRGLAGDAEPRRIPDGPFHQGVGEKRHAHFEDADDEKDQDRRHDREFGRATAALAAQKGAKTPHPGFHECAPLGIRQPRPSHMSAKRSRTLAMRTLNGKKYRMQKS